jgi:uncharacterized protein YdaU (DUF1376 family)
MSKRPWMPLYIEDYLGATLQLDAQEHGAYLLLLMWYWQHGPLPNNLRTLAKLTRLPNKNARSVLQLILNTFFELKGGDGTVQFGSVGTTRFDVDGTAWFNHRADVEIGKVVKKSTIARNNRLGKKITDVPTAVHTLHTSDSKPQSLSSLPPDSFASGPTAKKVRAPRAPKLEPSGPPALVLTEAEWQRIEMSYPDMKNLRAQVARQIGPGTWLADVPVDERKRALNGWLKNRNKEQAKGGVFAPDSREVTRPQNIVTPEQEKYNEEQRIRARAFREKNAHRGYIS